MTQKHPITPPPELVEQWMHEASGQPPGPDARVIATQAARWGADQELEACCEWLHSSLPGYDKHYADYLHAARRPKPPSLKELALGLLNEGPVSDLLDHEVALIRRALEQLND